MEALKSLIIRAQAGDMYAYGVIVQRFQDMAVGYAYSILGDFHLAEDAAQEAFIEAYLNLYQLREPEAFPSWFRKVVFKHCDRLIRGKRLEAVPLEAAAAIPSEVKGPAEVVEEKEMKDLVLAAIAELPGNQRMATTLFYINGYSQNEIADFLEVPATTINSRLQSARNRLKERITTMVKMAKTVKIVKDTLQEHRPSRDDAFVTSVLKPPDVSADTWAMFKAANDGDVKAIRRLLGKDPNLVQASYAYWQPLHFAARAGQAAVVKLLLEAGADPLTHIAWRGYRNALEMAQDRGHMEVIELLETALEKKYQMQADQGKLICDAVRTGDATRIKALLNKDAELVNISEISGSEIGGQKPLHLAVELGRVDLIDLLLERGADLNGTRGDSFKPIHVAIWPNFWWECRDNWLLVGYLLAKGAEDNICIAAARNDIESIREFLKQDSTLANFIDTCGKRPLSCAAERGHTEIVKLLLEHGADPNLPEANYASRGYALYAAAWRGHVEATKLLLEAGADANAPFHASGTASWAALGENKEISDLLYRHGAVAGLNAACHYGRLDIVAEVLAVQPSLVQAHIYNAIQQGKTEIVRLMLKRGAKLDPRRFYPWQTALGQTLVHRRLELAELLLEHGEDPNWPNWFGQRPLHYLVARDRPDTVEYILDRGADPNLRDWELESTPLGWAARQGNKAIVELLLRRGAKVNLPDDKDKPWATPLARAEKAEHTEIAKTLRKHGAKR